MDFQVWSLLENYHHLLIHLLLLSHPLHILLLLCFQKPHPLLPFHIFCHMMKGMLHLIPLYLQGGHIMEAVYDNRVVCSVRDYTNMALTLLCGKECFFIITLKYNLLLLRMLMKN